jgi:putative endonuclease
MILFRLTDAARQRVRRRWMTPSQALGRDGEDRAHRHLQHAGLIVVARNYRTPGGSAEVDLIARDGAWLVFVEVKTRQTDEFGAPDRAIDPIKRDKIRRAALNYLRRSGHDPMHVRFDVGVDRRRPSRPLSRRLILSKLPSQSTCFGLVRAELVHGR